MKAIQITKVAVAIALDGSQDSGNSENEDSGKTGSEDENNQGEGSQDNENSGSENKNTEDENLGEQNREDNSQSGNSNQNSENNSGNTTGNNTGNSNSGGAGNSNTGSGNNGNSTQNVQTSTEPVKSNNNNLRQLEIDVEGMTPEFNSNITEYYLIVDLSVETISVTAIPADNKAKVEITGNNNLKEGENNIRITVTAEDETKKDYIIHVTKTENKEKANANLKSLNIEGYNISPDFKSNIYYYNLSVNESIKNLNVMAEAENANAQIEITGNNDLKEGENLIEINVTAEDETTIKKYKVNVYIDTEKVEIAVEDKMPAIILLVVLVIAAISILIFILVKKRK